MSRKNLVRDGGNPSPPTSRESSHSSSSIHEDLFPTLCGQETLNSILAAGSPTRTAKSGAVEQVSLVPEKNQKKKAYKSQLRKDSPTNSKGTRRKAQDDKDDNDGGAMEGLSFVTEVPIDSLNSILDTEEDSTGSSMSSISLNTTKRSNRRSSSSSRAHNDDKKSKEGSSKRDKNGNLVVDNETIRPMKDIIMQQHSFICQLGRDNKQYRKKMLWSQEQVTALQKEQAEQKSELRKLRTERRSMEAEAASLRDEVETLKLQLLVKTFTERRTSSAKKLSSKNQETPPVSFVSFDSTQLPPTPAEKESAANYCIADLQELQATGVELYESVSKLTLEQTEPMGYSEGCYALKNDEEEKHHSSNSSPATRGSAEQKP